MISFHDSSLSDVRLLLSTANIVSEAGGFEGQKEVKDESKGEGGGDEERKKQKNGGWREAKKREAKRRVTTCHCNRELTVRRDGRGFRVSL